MDNAKLTIRAPKDLIEGAKRHARRRNASLKKNHRCRTLSATALAVVAITLLLAGCAAPAAAPQAVDEEAGQAGMLTLPAPAPAPLQGRPLNVVATTSIIGDVVGQVGGDAIQLTMLMGPGQDPHSYQPAARDLTQVAEADAIFINGWDLEEALIDDLRAIGEDAPLVPVSANIAPLAWGDPEHEGEAGAHSGADPHTWFSVRNVEQWTKNIEQALGGLDPANAATYERNAAAYLAQLAQLEAYATARLAAIPAARRFLVTNHSVFSYFARDYNFTVLGAVIPAPSTLAEPSASDLAGLIEAMQAVGLCTIFTETTVSDALAQTVAAELAGCDAVQILPLYTGAIGPAGSGADSYIGMFRHNVDAISAGLQ